MQNLNLHKLELSASPNDCWIPGPKGMFNEGSTNAFRVLSASTYICRYKYARQCIDRHMKSPTEPDSQGHKDSNPKQLDTVMANGAKLTGMNEAMKQQDIHGLQAEPKSLWQTQQNKTNAIT